MERQTRQKKAVIEALEASGRSLSPTEIWALAQRGAPSLNLSTVYRQLKALHDDAQIVRVDLPGQSPRFEAVCRSAEGGRSRGPGDAHPEAPHHHHHFHCEVCDLVMPIAGCPDGIDRLAPAGFTVERHDLTLHGRCSQCARAGR